MRTSLIADENQSSTMPLSYMQRGLAVLRVLFGALRSEVFLKGNLQSRGERLQSRGDTAEI